MTFELFFTVEGNPRGKGRPRFSRVGKFTKTYTDAKTKAYEQIIAEAATQAMKSKKPLETPLVVQMRFGMPIPSSYSKKRKEACLSGLEMPTKKPDIDNIAKAFLDAMNAIVYVDDVQVVRLIAQKYYSTAPSVLITITEIVY